MDSINKIIKDNIEIEPVYVKKRGLVLFRKEGDLIYISGHGPQDQITVEPLFRGRIGQDLTPEEGYAAARECAIIILSALKDILGSLDKIKRVVKVFGLVSCGDGFTDVDKIMDGFSDTIADVLEERGYHARTVMGTHILPLNIPVEIEAIFSVDDWMSI